MPKTVHIYGAARNVREAPLPSKGVEVWLSNSPTTTLIRCPRAINYWTRWFNLHSVKHMKGAYPAGYSYYGTKAEGRPVYFLKVQPDVPTSIAFPREKIQAAFATKKGPNRYFTCSVAWLIAFAILEGFERIELWGFELRDSKLYYKLERPCVFYWIKQARDRGIEVTYQAAIEKIPFEPGDPDDHKGPLYGYSTKPEPDWDLETESWKTEDKSK